MGIISIRDRVHSDQLATRKILVAIVAFSVVARVFGSVIHGQYRRMVAGHCRPGIVSLNWRCGFSGGMASFGETWWPITAADAPTAHWSFLYTLYLTVVYAILGQIRWRLACFRRLRSVFTTGVVVFDWSYGVQPAGGSHRGLVWRRQSTSI